MFKDAKLHQVAEALKPTGLSTTEAWAIREQLMIEKDPIKIRKLREDLYALRGIQLKPIETDEEREQAAQEAQ